MLPGAMLGGAKQHLGAVRPAKLLRTYINRYGVPMGDVIDSFGGVYYLFLRGMHPDYSSGNGVYYTVPPRELIEQLDACFGSMEEG